MTMMIQATTIHFKGMVKRLRNQGRDRQMIKIKECADPSATTREQQQNMHTTA
jgi:hypothetical protein